MTRPSSLADLASIFDSQPISGTRNRIINGAMEIAQRATTATGAYTSVYVYASVDRWAVFSPNSSTTQAQSTDVPAGFRNSFRVQRPAGNTGTGPLLFAQAIESVNCYDLSGQPVTLSFWAKRGTNYSGGNLSFTVITGTVADQGIGLVGAWTGRQTPLTSSASITTTWTRYTITGTFGSGVLEAGVEFSWAGTGTAGADDSVYITGVQLEAGPFATPFERRSFGQELMLCQRYFYALPNTSNLANGMWGSLYTTNAGRVWVKFPVPMRATPVMSGTATSNVFEIVGLGNIATSTLTNIVLSGECATFDGTSLSSTGAMGQPFAYRGPAQFNAEL